MNGNLIMRLFTLALVAIISCSCALTSFKYKPHYDLALKLQEQGRFEEAYKEMKLVSNNLPYITEYHVDAAAFLFYTGNYDAADIELQAALIKPNTREQLGAIYIVRAWNYFEAGKYDLAFETFRQALIYPEDVVPAERGLAQTYARLGKYEDAYDALKELYPNEEGKASHLLWGKVYYFAEDLKKSLEECTTALKGSPDSLEALIGLARAHAALGQRKEAEETFTKAISKHPKAPEAYLYRGICFLESGALDKAESDFKEVYKLADMKSRVFNCAYFNLSLVSRARLGLKLPRSSDLDNS
jgi:tetratricopeptide (TPR) repeat protein